MLEKYNTRTNNNIKSFVISERTKKDQTVLASLGILVDFENVLGRAVP